MPKKVEISLLCDFCAEVGEENPGEILDPISMAGVKRGQPGTLIACEPHKKDVEHMASILADYGDFGDGAQPMQPQARQRGPRIPRPVVQTPCRICKELFERDWSASNWEALQSHRANTHGVPNSAYRLWINGLAKFTVKDKDALTVSVEKLEIPPGIPDYLQCPAEGCEVGYDPHDKDEDSAFRSLANHTSRAHPELPPLRSLVGL